MKIRSYVYILLACYSATFLRVFINNNFIVSIVGSLLFGFVIAKKLSSSKEKINSIIFPLYRGNHYFL